MTLDFRASQFRGAKFIASGSTGTGAKLVFYDIANDSTGTPNQGNINTATWNTSSIGNDIFLFVSGTVLSGTSDGRITAFGGSVKVSGVLSVGTGSIYLSGSTIIFTNPPYNSATAIYDSSNNGVLIANHNINDGSFMSPFAQFKPVNMTIRAASTANSGSGGSLSLNAGAGGYRYGSGDMSGGAVQIVAGSGGSQAEPSQDAGNGGNVSVSAGTGGSVEDLGTPGTGGNVTLTAGNGGFSLVDGGGSAGGNVNLTAGTGGAGQVGYSGGNGGNINLTGGDPTSPGPNTGGNVNITAGGDLFGFVDCTPGSVNVKSGQNAISGTIGKITFYGENLPIPGRDAYFVVSGTIATGSNAKLASFESSVKVSGSIGFSNSTYIQREGNDLKFYDGINPQGYSLSQLASSSGGGGGDSTLLYDMPISTASVSATPRRINTAGGGFNNTVAPAATVVASRAIPSRNALSLTADCGGGWVWEVQHGIDPSLLVDGYILEMELDRVGGASGFDCVIWPLLDFVSPGGDDTAAGVMLVTREAAQTIWVHTSTPTSGGFANPSAALVSFSNGWGASPSTGNAAPLNVRVTVRRLASQTPAEWSVLVETDSGAKWANRVSGVSDPVTGLDGRALSTFGLGVWVNAGGHIDVEISVTRFRVFSLDR